MYQSNLLQAHFDGYIYIHSLYIDLYCLTTAFIWASPVKRYLKIEDILNKLMDVHFAGPVDLFQSQDVKYYE